MMHQHLTVGQYVIIAGAERARVDEVYEDRFFAGHMCFARLDGKHVGHPSEGRWTREKMDVAATPDTPDDLGMDGPAWMPVEVGP